MAHPDRVFGRSNLSTPPEASQCVPHDRKVDTIFLREYVYVDVDRVRGLASQLYDGVPERATNVVARQKKLEMDVKILRGGNSAGVEDSTERSLADSLFKDLETDLEALGLLADVSEDLTKKVAWEKIEAIAAPGRILRVTAPGTLFHPAQMSEAIVGMATAAHGLEDLGVGPEGENSPIPPKAKTEAQKKAERLARTQFEAEPRFPEDFLPAGDVIPVMGVARKQMAGMIKVIRGVFGEGVHLHLRPLGIDGPAISARLEPGRRFLDSSPEVLFSRYGLSQQEWTVVGVVGQLGRPVTHEESNDVTNEDGSINRAKVVDLVGHFLGQTAGLIDLPQDPGFSVIPLAVYRTIGGSFATDS